MSMPSGTPVRMLALAFALTLSALLLALYLSTPAQAQNVPRDDIVRITDVFSGTQSASVVIVLEYPRDTFNTDDTLAVAYPYLYLRLCDACDWTRANPPTSPKKVYGQPRQVQTRVSLPQLCPSTDYGMDVAIHSQDLSNPLQTDFTPDSTPHGFGFPSVEGPTIGTISGTVDSTTATVLVFINSENSANKTIYLRYRVYDSGDAWTTTNGVDRNEVDFTLTGLSSDAYYEIEASMGEDFMSCTVIKAIGTIGSPTGESPPTITTPTEPSIISTSPTTTTTTTTTTEDNGGGGFGFGGGQPANASPVFRDSASEPRTVPENSEEGAKVGNPVYAWDPNNDEFAYSLRGDDAELFAIDELTGQLLVGPEALLDYEGDRNIFSVEVVAKDTLGDASYVSVQVHLTDVILPGRANEYDLANNHNELVEREEVVTAAADFTKGLLTKREMLEITKLYYGSAFGSIDFDDLPLMVDKYDLNRDSVIDRSEVLAALKDYFEGRITKADMQQVVKVYFNTAIRGAQQTEAPAEPADTGAEPG